MNFLIPIFLLLAVLLSVIPAYDHGHGGHGGYGGGAQVISMPGGGGKGWKMKAKGKGMSNLVTMGGGGGGGGGDGGHEVIYYPIPIYTPMHDHHDDYGHHESQSHVQVIPIHGGGHSYGSYGGYMGGGMEHMGYGYH